MKFRDKVAREIVAWTLSVLASRAYSNYIGDIMELGRAEFAKRLARDEISAGDRVKVVKVDDLGLHFHLGLTGVVDYINDDPDALHPVAVIFDGGDYDGDSFAFDELEVIK